MTFRKISFFSIVFALSLKMDLCWTKYQTEGHNTLENSPIEMVRGVLGGRALLPCDFTPPSPRDSPILVLFFIDNKKTPIFSLDSRDSNLNTAQQWSDPDVRGRTSLQSSSGAQGLILRGIRPEDEGVYRCRVDFKSSPTANSRIQLDIIEPPKNLLITAKWREERVVSRVAGPYPEGAEITLSCQVRGGSPPPSVTWWHEGSLLDDSVESRNHQVTRNNISLLPLTRRDLLKNLTCQALNSNLTSPLSATVSIDLAFPPTSVKIVLGLNSRTPGVHASRRVITVSEGEKSSLLCHVEGARPKAVVNWTMDEKDIKEVAAKRSGKLKSLRSRSFSSTVVLFPRASDNDSLVTCRASNPLLPGQGLFDTIRLNVLYKPRVTLSQGRKIDLSDIREGTDVYFECQVDSNPDARKITWYKDGSQLLHDASKGILISSSGHSLILQDISRSLSGSFNCRAENLKGMADSNYLSIDVKYVPVCSDEVGSSVGGGLHQEVNAICRVSSHPPPLYFRWAFNSSKGLQEIDADIDEAFKTSGRSITYKIRSTEDFGSFLCWASNVMGDMESPCVIKITPAAKPEAVTDCKISYNSSIPGGEVFVRCLRSWDGGLDQSFTLEVRKAALAHTKVLSALEHSSTPSFGVRDLQTGVEYLFTVTASNARGNSLPVSLLYTVPGEVIAGLIHARPGTHEILQKMIPLIGVVLGIVVTVVIIAISVVCIVRYKHRKRKNPSLSESGDSASKDTTASSSNSVEKLLRDKSGVKVRADQRKGQNGVHKHPLYRQNTTNFIGNNECCQKNGLLRGSAEHLHSDPSFFCQEEMEKDCELPILSYGFSSCGGNVNSLGRSSTRSAESSASHPTFRSSQSTVIFNPKLSDDQKSEKDNSTKMYCH